MQSFVAPKMFPKNGAPFGPAELTVAENLLISEGADPFLVTKKHLILGPLRSNRKSNTLAEMTPATAQFHFAMLQ